MPTNTLRGNDPQTPILSAVRESQTAFIDVVRSWTDITEQLTRRLSLPVVGIDVAGALDRAFDLAEQTLAAQRQFALTLAGVATRQAATAVERIDGAVEAVDTAVETVETTGIETAHRIEGELQRGRERVAPPQASTVTRQRLSRPSRTASGTGAPMRSAASRSSASALGSWRSKAAQP